MFHCFNKTKHLLVVAATLYANVCAPLLANTTPQETPVNSAYQTLANLHLPALTTKAEEEKKVIQKWEKENAENITSLFKLSKVAIRPVQEVEKLQLAYRIFSDSEPSQAKKQSDILSLNTLQDLEMFCGYSGQLQNYVFKNIDLTQTAFGSIQLQKMLLTPQDNVEKLKHRQEIIKTLVNDENLLNSLITHLEKIKAAEQDLLWFWRDLEGAVQQLVKGLGFPDFAFFSSLNKNPAALQTWRMFNSILTPGALTLWSLFGAYATALGIRHNNQRVIMQGSFVFTYSALLTTLVGYIALVQANMVNTVHGKVNGVAAFAKATEELGKIIDSHVSLKELFPVHKLLKNVVSPLTEESRDLIDLLKTDTFKSDPTFFSYQGRALAAFNVMKDVKDQFISSMHNVGQLDAYVSIARLYKKYEHARNVRFCFVDYVNQDTPHLAIQDFWHPSLNSETVVLNSITLGSASGPQSTIVTGPNAGGKSTALKSISLAVLLAQSFGIAPARSMSLKPFSKINTYMNITDSAGSASLFQAEMRRTQELLQTIKTLAPNQSAFIIMDEIFTGTNAKEGEAGAYGVAKKLAGFQNCVCIFATHFKRLTELAQASNGVIENRKVSVIKNTDGSFTFPYKLEPGITDQAIALDLLGLEGFDDDILQAAHDIMDQARA